MKASELRDMSANALEEELLKLRREQFNLRMAKATGQETEQNDIRRVRRDIARIKTIMTEAASKAAGEA
ncbi:MAG: 50S ribosomal protein L29 [Pseudomonadota bacterium]